MRHRLGWTQAELGAFFGVSHLTAHKWCKSGVSHSEITKGALRALEVALEDAPAPEDRQLTLEYHSSDEAGLSKADLSKALLETSVAAFLAGGTDEEVTPLRVFRLRDTLDWTQAEFGAFFGVSYTTPAVWESKDININEATRGALLALEIRVNQKEKQRSSNEWRRYTEELPTTGISEFLVEEVSSGDESRV